MLRGKKKKKENEWNEPIDRETIKPTLWVDYSKVKLSPYLDAFVYCKYVRIVTMRWEEIRNKQKLFKMT